MIAFGWYEIRNFILEDNQKRIAFEEKLFLQVLSVRAFKN